MTVDDEDYEEMAEYHREWQERLADYDRAAGNGYEDLGGEEVGPFEAPFPGPAFFIMAASRPHGITLALACIPHGHIVHLIWRRNTDITFTLGRVCR